jgi:hypothetical protein
LSIVDQKLVLSSYGLLNLKTRTLSSVDWAMLATGTALWLVRLVCGVPEFRDSMACYEPHLWNMGFKVSTAPGRPLYGVWCLVHVGACWCGVFWRLVFLAFGVVGVWSRPTGVASVRLGSGQGSGWRPQCLPQDHHTSQVHQQHNPDVCHCGGFRYSMFKDEVRVPQGRVAALRSRMPQQLADHDTGPFENRC